MTTQPANFKYSDLLGRGYNGWEYYANPLSIVRRLYDVSPSPKTEVDYVEAHVSDTFAIQGDSIQNYTINMSASVGVGPVTSFIKSLSLSFGADSLSKATSKFGSFNQRIAFARAELLHAPLLPEAANDLKTMDPVELFNAYGTHYIRSAILGGRLTFASSLDSSETTDSLNAKVICDVGEEFLKAGNVNISGKSEAYKKDVLARATLSTVGGDPSLPSLQLGDLKDGGTASPKAEAWAKSIQDHQSIADFGTGGLKPIYELIQDAARRTAVEAAWLKFMKEKSAIPIDSNPGAALHFGDPFYLKWDNGAYLSAAEKMDAAAWSAVSFNPAAAVFLDTYEYYPTIRKGSPNRLSFARPDDTGAGTPVAEGEFVNLITSESLTGALGGWGATYNRLGAWGDDWFVYYYRQGKGGPYDQEQWSIQRLGGASGGPLRYGDRVRIVSKSYPGQQLCPGGASLRNRQYTFVTSKPAAPGAWTIVKP